MTTKKIVFYFTLIGIVTFFGWLLLSHKMTSYKIQNKEIPTNATQVTTTFNPTESFKGTNLNGEHIVLEQENYTKYRLTISGITTSGDMNTERGWKNDANATIYVLNWNKSEEEQQMFVRKTGSTSLIEIDSKGEELKPKIELILIQ